jgi:acyl-CoA thioesterase FadM
MARWLRFLLTLLRARGRPPLQVGDTSRIELRVWPTECDASFLSHAALMVLMECGRIDLMVRFGFLGLARRERWFLPLVTASVRFDRPVRRLQCIGVASRIVAWDDAAIWIEHLVTSGDRRVASALVKLLVRRGRENVEPEDILRTLGKEVPPRPAAPPSYAEFV